MTHFSDIITPEDVDAIPCKIPRLEFWVCLYRKEFLERNNIRFFEYKEQDIETAFRFRAFSKTDNIAVHKDIALVLHRSNPNSNINTWNTRTLYRIKAKVYLQLFHEYDKSDIQISSNLYAMYLHCYCALCKYCFRDGIPQEQMQIIQEDFRTLAKGLPFHRQVTLRHRDRFYAFVLRILSMSFPLYLFCQICKARNQ